MSDIHLARSFAVYVLKRTLTHNISLFALTRLYTRNAQCVPMTLNNLSHWPYGVTWSSRVVLLFLSWRTAACHFSILLCLPAFRVTTMTQCGWFRDMAWKKMN